MALTNKITSDFKSKFSMTALLLHSSGYGFPLFHVFLPLFLPSASFVTFLISHSCFTGQLLVCPLSLFTRLTHTLTCLPLCHSPTKTLFILPHTPATCSAQSAPYKVKLYFILCWAPPAFSPQTFPSSALLHFWLSCFV